LRGILRRSLPGWSCPPRGGPCHHV
jgi:hypothetical protein